MLKYVRCGLRVKRVAEWFTQFVLPTMQFAVQQGTNVDVAGIIAWMGKEYGIEEVDEFYVPANDSSSLTLGENMWSGIDKVSPNGETQQSQMAQILGQKQPAAEDEASKQNELGVMAR